MSNELTVIKQPENWIHYSSSPSQILMATRNPQNDMFVMKPRGLWITPEYAKQNWFDWASGEDFRMGDLNFVHDVTFHKDANLLRLDTSAQIIAFTNEYGYNLLESLGHTRKTMILRQRLQHLSRSTSSPVRARTKSSSGMGMDSIHWNKVSEKYHGILIPKYHWNLRLHEFVRWYYPWDCASGCIWDASAVDSITVRPGESAGYVSDNRSISELLVSGRELMKDVTA